MKPHELIKNYLDIEEFKKKIKLDFDTQFSSTDYDKAYGLNEFIRNATLKKQYIKKLKNKISILNDTKNIRYKTLNNAFPFKGNWLLQNDFLVKYIFSVVYSKTNTLLHVTDCSGKLKFFCSAGVMKFTGKGKTSRYHVFGKFRKLLVTRFKFMKYKPIALHLKNVGTNKSWILRKLKRKFFIRIIRTINSDSHNGCRKPKKRRKKFRKRF